MVPQPRTWATAEAQIPSLLASCIAPDISRSFIFASRHQLKIKSSSSRSGVLVVEIKWQAHKLTRLPGLTQFRIGMIPKLHSKGW